MFVCFFHKPLLYISNLSKQKKVFQDELKIFKVTLMYGSNEETDIGNYSSISVLPCFSKTLGRIGYNRLYEQLNSNNNSL